MIIFPLGLPLTIKVVWIDGIPFYKIVSVSNQKHHIRLRYKKKKTKALLSVYLTYCVTAFVGFVIFGKQACTDLLACLLIKFPILYSNLKQLLV